MRSRRFAAMLFVTALLAAACADDASTSSTADPPDPESLEAPTGVCDASGAFAAGQVAATCPALDPSVDASEFPVDQISSTEREDVASALDGESDESFAEPTIDLSRIRSGGPGPDGIPSIDNPIFQNASAVDWLSAAEAVLALEVEGETRGYPIQVLTWHELVNDTIGDTPVTISYCPLCNSALAYDRRIGDRIVDFGTSGRLFNSSMVMYDRQTESLWTHFDASSVAGFFAGVELDTFPISTVSWEDFRTANPDALVLTRNTGFRRDYGRNPYEGYDDPGSRPFLYDGEYDPRLEAKARVVVVRDADDPAIALPLRDLGGVRVFDAHGRSLVAVLDPGTASPLDGNDIAGGYDQGAVGVFENRLDGVELDLSRTDDGFLDATSGVTFDIFGRALDDSGLRLTAVEHLDTFWFAIAAFEPDVEIVGS